ncbi:MAG: ABC transporter ATP-binding protein [Christensenellales bacterium]|jgi:ABC-type nitrate/sulfonate/bicarbonate transport system ATPase subunit
MADEFLRVERLTKSYGELEVLKDLSFTVQKGEFLCVVGPTGCGKTTFLSCLIGAQPVDSGSITMEGEAVDLKKRNIAYIMQEYSAMPWLTVRQNAAFGLMIRRVPKKQADEAVDEVLELVGLSRFADYYPRQLSAGMLQRVAIARAFAVSPELLLMDEPYGQLDLDLRFRLEDELLKLCEKHNTTVIFITHNIEEAVYLGQRVLVLTSKPTTIRDEVIIDLPYPRDVADRDFVSLRTKITEQIRWW